MYFGCRMASRLSACFFQEPLQSKDLRESLVWPMITRLTSVQQEPSNNMLLTCLVYCSSVPLVQNLCFLKSNLILVQCRKSRNQPFAIILKCGRYCKWTSHKSHLLIPRKVHNHSPNNLSKMAPIFLSQTFVCKGYNSWFNQK